MQAQTASVVVLRRPEAHTWPHKVYLEGMAPQAFDGLATVVDNPADADAAVVRLAAPFEPRDDFVLEPFFHAGSLEFSDDVVANLADLTAQAPLIVDVTLDRPAVLTPVADLASVLLGSFSSSDRALALVVTGHATPTGKLPFDLPASMAAVERSPALADLPDQKGWRIEPGADYGPLSTFAGRIDLRKVRRMWPDILRVVASICLRRIPLTEAGAQRSSWSTARAGRPG